MKNCGEAYIFVGLSSPSESFLILDSSGNIISNIKTINASNASASTNNSVSRTMAMLTDKCNVYMGSKTPTNNWKIMSLSLSNLSTVVTP